MLGIKQILYKSSVYIPTHDDNRAVRTHTHTHIETDIMRIDGRRGDNFLDIYPHT